MFYAKNENEAETKPNLRSSKKADTSQDILLDPNHTHFILVDDGSEGKFGKEIKFRAQLEAELRKGKPLKHYENNLKKRQYSNSAVVYEETETNEKEDQSLVPMVLIVVQGGPNTLLTVKESIKENMPVLVLYVKHVFSS